MLCIDSTEWVFSTFLVTLSGSLARQHPTRTFALGLMLTVQTTRLNSFLDTGEEVRSRERVIERIGLSFLLVLWMGWLGVT